MPKIMVNEFNNHYSNDFVNIYPIDYVYCQEMIKALHKTNGLMCYSCNDKISYKEMFEISDFEMTFFHCGHLHHTACILSDNKLNYKKCHYCCNNKKSKIIKDALERAYYGCILAYDMKNPDYISTISEFTQTYNKTKHIIHKPETVEQNECNINIKIKNKDPSPVLRRSERLMKKNNKNI